MLSISHINKSFGPNVILHDITFALAKGEKAALVGSNGSGKTTLMKIVAENDEADTGIIEKQKDIKISYLPQDTGNLKSETIHEYFKRSLSVDKDSIEHKVQPILSGFGLKNLDLKTNITKLSSGQKTKVVLAGILLSNPDILLLDEPTNNLDIPALIWLENYLKNDDLSAIIISHDRRFLDAVTTKILEIDSEEHTITMSGGKYSDYLNLKLRKLDNQKDLYRAQQKEIKRLTSEIHNKKEAALRGAKWVAPDNDKLVQGFKRDMAAGSARRAKAMEKNIEQMDKIEKPIEKAIFEVLLNASKNPGTLHIELTEVIAGYDNGFKIGPFTLDIPYGKRIAIMGLNGSGKSTILKTITGKIQPISGKVEVGSGNILGNMMQEHETLPRDITLLDYIQSRTDLDEPNAFNQLVKFGLTEAEVRHKIGTLSPGGRARLILSLFSFQNVNTLILDEPTNHLDIEAIAALEEALETYNGTVILVSHDRYFLEKTKLDSIYSIEGESKPTLVRIKEYEAYINNTEEKARKILQIKA